MIRGGRRRTANQAHARPPAAGDEDARRANALAQAATMVSAMVLARATEGSPISDELLAAAREHLLQAE
ncbi:hypothetical protein [Castellaniella sp. GW247-6E4]|uniref:hypothetical protein n=1 Tax=Castellaniella sp. GW247-6E4 TaxID=3140380 RepID=UPI003314DD2B